MVKVNTLPIVTNTPTSSQFNSAMSKITDALSNTLSRDGSTPNTMSADLDLNDNDILNVGTLNASNISLNGQSLDTTVDTTLNFVTRDDLVTWSAAATKTVGMVATASGFSYYYTGSGTIISDLAGWLPLGDAYPDHWKLNATPGTTDMASAIQSALTNYASVYLAKASYAVGTSINILNRKITGDHHINGSRLIGLSASILVTDPIVKIGGESSLISVRISYDSITGNETQGQRVGLRTWADGSNGTLQRGSVLDQLRFETVGTAISDGGVGFFSVTVGTIDIRSYSYRGIDLYASGRTGSVFTNVYMNNTTYTPDAGVSLFKGGSENFIQLNIEHSPFNTAALKVDGCQGVKIQNLHLEGVDHNAASKGYVSLENTDVQIDKCRIVNTRMTTYDNVSLFRFGRAGSIETGGSSREFSQLESYLHIGELSVQGLASPDNSVYPTYPSGRNGVVNIPGFYFFTRDPSYTDSLWNIQVDAYVGGPYNLNSPADDPWYDFPDKKFSGKLNFIRFKERGRYVPQGENLVSNGAFDQWYGTSVTASSAISSLQLAKNWNVIATSGSVVATKVANSDGLFNSDYIQLAVTAGTFQALTQDIPFTRENSGDKMRLEFWMKANTSGQVLEQITASLTNTGGTPSTFFLQVAPGANILAETDWKYYAFDFTPVKTSDASVWGSNPYITLQFQFNAGSATRSPTVSFRSVRLSKPWGEVFTRNPYDRNKLTSWEVTGLDHYGAIVWRPQINTTTINAIGVAAPTATGTATAAATANTNVYTYTPKVEYVSAAAAVNAIAGFYGTERVVSIGGQTAGNGGFRFSGKFGIATAATNVTHRAFFGLTNSIAAPTDVEPSTLISCVGIGYDSADANIQFLINDGSGTCTKIDLGSDFVVPTADRTEMYELKMRSPSGTEQRLEWLVTNLTTGASKSGVCSGNNMPPTTTLMVARGWMGSGATNAFAGCALGGLSITPFI